MRETFIPAHACAGRGERGSARVRFIAVLAVVAVLGYMGFQYVPVAYQSYRFKKEMDDATEIASASGKPTEWLKNQIMGKANEYNVPPATLRIGEPIVRDGRMEITVQFARVINILPFWAYNYTFEHTSKSNTFLTSH